MLNELVISLSPESLSEGASEERATFGQLVFSSGTAVLTEGFDYYINANRRGRLYQATLLLSGSLGIGGA